MKRILLLSFFLFAFFGAVMSQTTETQNIIENAHNQAHQSAVETHNAAMSAHTHVHENAMETHNKAHEHHMDFNRKQFFDSNIFPAVNPSIRYRGGVIHNSDGTVTLSGKGSSVEVSFTGGIIAFILADAEHGAFDVYLNGSFYREIQPSDQDSIVLLLSKRPRRKQIVKLVSKAQENESPTTISAVELRSRGRILDIHSSNL